MRTEWRVSELYKYSWNIAAWASSGSSQSGPGCCAFVALTTMTAKTTTVGGIGTARVHQASLGWRRTIDKVCRQSSPRAPLFAPLVSSLSLLLLFNASLARRRQRDRVMMRAHCQHKPLGQRSRQHSLAVPRVVLFEQNFWPPLRIHCLVGEWAPLVAPIWSSLSLSLSGRTCFVIHVTLWHLKLDIIKEAGHNAIRSIWA